MWFSGEGGGRDSGESLNGFGDVLNSGLTKQVCQGTPGLTVGRKDSVHTVPIPISVDLRRTEVSGWNLQNFILELWRNTALLFLRPLCHKEGSFGKNDTKAGSLILPF